MHLQSPSVRYLIPLFAAFTILSPAQAAERNVLIGSFEELLIEGDMRVILDNMKPPSARVSGDQQLIDAIKIERNGLTVRIRIQEYEGQEVRKAPTAPIVIRLGGRNVSRISVDGSANFEANMIRSLGRPATLKLSGPGSITIGKLESDKLDLSAAGSGSVTIGSGQVRTARFKVDGNVSTDTSKVAMQQANLIQSGNAKTHLFVSQTVEISNSGAGLIKVDGKATCFIRQPGSARIECGKMGK